MAEIPIFSPLVTHVPEVGKTSKFFWYILRWTRHHKKIFKFLGQKGSEICKVKYRDFEIFFIYTAPHIHINRLLQNQKVCWLLAYHDSFMSILQIYAQKTRI